MSIVGSTARSHSHGSHAPLVFVALFLLAAASGALTSAMVGGASPASASIARSVVMVLSSASTVCTATVVARELLLTVAHCVLPGADYQVVEPRAERFSVLADILAVAHHPGFDLKTLFAHRANADVALLKLAAPLPASFLPVSLPLETQSVAIGETFVVAG